jgi:hypothetical protein
MIDVGVSSSSKTSVSAHPCDSRITPLSIQWFIHKGQMWEVIIARNETRR